MYYNKKKRIWFRAYDVYFYNNTSESYIIYFGALTTIRPFPKCITPCGGVWSKKKKKTLIVRYCFVQFKFRIISSSQNIFCTPRFCFDYGRTSPSMNLITSAVRCRFCLKTTNHTSKTIGCQRIGRGRTLWEHSLNENDEIRLETKR